MEINKSKKSIKIFKTILITFFVFIILILVDFVSIGIRKMPLIILDVSRDECSCFHYKGLFYYTSMCDYDDSPNVSLNKIGCEVEYFDVKPIE